MLTLQEEGSRARGWDSNRTRVTGMFTKRTIIQKKMSGEKVVSGCLKLFAV